MKKFFLGLGLLAILAAVLYSTAPEWLAPKIESTLNRVEPHDSYVIDESVQRLHDGLFVADLHSDSLLFERDLLRRADIGHMDLPRLQAGNFALQVFSATTKSPAGQNYEKNIADSDRITLLSVAQGWPPATWRSLYARAQYQLEKLIQLAADAPDKLMLIRTRADLESLLARRAAGSAVVGAMYLIEGAHALDGELDNLDRLQARGLHFVGLTHFFDNRIGGSLHGTSGEGLTPFGCSVVRRADELQMTVDVAHASPQMVRDVLALSERPVVLSHGGFKGHCDTPRNLDDQLMREIAAKGGLIGVGFWDAAVCDPSPAGVASAIRYGIDLLGLEHIALGSDYDGTTTVTFDSAEIAVLTQAMVQQGFTEAEIRAVMGENLQRFLLVQLPR